MENKTTKLAQNTLPCVLDELYLTAYDILIYFYTE